MRLGYPGRTFGLPTPAAVDGAQGQGSPGRSPCSALLLRLRDLLVYLRSRAIRMYRLDARLATQYGLLLAAEEGEPLFAYEAELRRLGALAAEGDVRLSFHAHGALALNTPEEERLLESLGSLVAMARCLDALGQGPEGLVVLHGGGTYGDKSVAEERFVRRYTALPEAVRRRTCLENDDRRFSLGDALRLHARCGVPVVFDPLHHDVLNPEGLPQREALAAALDTWPAGVIPKVHYATPRSETRRRAPGGGIKVPTWTEHADFVNPFAFAAFMQSARGLRPFDVMLEARARDLALLKLREDLKHFRPDLAGEAGF